MSIQAAKLIVEIGADISKLQNGLKTSNSALQSFGSGAQTAGMGLTTFITAPAIAAGAGMLKVAMAAEQSEIAFTTMLGSGVKARAFLDDLQGFAERTPFEFTDLQTAARRMMAMGFAAEDVLPMMTDIGDAVSGLGLGTDGVNRVTLALGQMQAKGKVSAQEMTQLTEAGIPAWKYLAESMGLSTAEAMNLSERGLIPAGDAIQYILEGMRGDFGGMMAAQAQTAAGQYSNLVDEITGLARSMGKLLLPTVKELMVAAKGMAENFAALPVETQKNILSMVGLAAAVGPALIGLGSVARAASGLIGVMPAVASGAKAVGAAFSAMKGASSIGGALSVAGTGLAGITAVALPAAAAIAAVAVVWNHFISEANKAGGQAVGSAWTQFLNDQVKSGKNATEVLKEFQAAQAAAAAQTQVSWGELTVGNFLSGDRSEFAKLFIDQKQLKVNADELNLALAMAAGSYNEYTSAVLASGEPIRMMGLAEWEATYATTALSDAAAGTDLSNLQSGVDATTIAMDAMAQAAQGNMSDLQGLIGTYDSLKGQMDGWVSDTASSVQNMLGQALPESSGLYRDALGEIDDIMGTQYTSQLNLKESVQGLVDQYARTGDLEAFRGGLTKIKEEGLADMQTQLEDTATKAGELYTKLLELPEEIKIRIGFDVEALPNWIEEAVVPTVPGTGPGDNPNRPIPRALGGLALAGELYQVNERKMEYFIPAQNGRVTPLRAGAGSDGRRGGDVNVYATVANQIDLYQLGNIIRTQMLRGEL